MSLAYVFWHWPQRETDVATYEKQLAEFHRMLGEARPKGFSGSATFRLQGAPWMEGAGYEDWYLVQDSAALDPLNEAAVAAAVKRAHDAAALHTAGGTAGLYRWRAGAGKCEEGRVAHWFAKPAGTGYEELYERLKLFTQQPGVALWQRQMVLGPTPEFCLRAGEPLELPPALDDLAVKLERIWP